MSYGIDIVDVRRFVKLMERFGRRLEERLYTLSERKVCSDDLRRGAAYFAIKEAVAKALGVGIDHISNKGINLLEVEVRETAGHSLGVKLSGRALCLAMEMGLQKWAASYSHSSDLAIAFVTAERS
ncbi:4'-phosphopantetheinyl transferase superfamily protein [uncultured archaeon]|nr:4'-phosphopantetheinyl transferase superfamily protein [uncultured archaeon]